MNSHSKTMKALSIIVTIFITKDLSMGQADKAYQHLCNVMDKYNKTYDIFTDQDAGGNNYHPTLFGDFNKLEMTSGCSDDSLPGWSCIKTTYSSSSPSYYGWAGIYWLYPDKNWGDYTGHNLANVDSLVFWAKGNSGGEKVEFKVGGINHFPGYDRTKPYMDSADLLSTGVITLDKHWKKYAIDLVTPENFAIYIDGNSGSKNHYLPAQWFNGSNNMRFNDNYTLNPKSGSTCIRIDWTGKGGTDTGLWNGIMWQAIEGNTKNGYDLHGATKITFSARTDNQILKIKFFVGYKTDSSGEIYFNNDGFAIINTNWQDYTIDLTNKNMSNVSGGFGFAFAFIDNPQYPNGFTFYIDDIKFDKKLKKDFSNSIGGFCCAIEKAKNPGGCTFYLDNIGYHFSESGLHSVKQDQHFLTSYEATASPTDSFIRNPAYIYDNALAMLAFMAQGSNDAWQRAEVLANTFLACQHAEPVFADSRLRNGYQSGFVIDELTKKAVLPGIWKEKERVPDEFSANTHTGNIAWVMIALLKYYSEKGGSQYLDCAITLANWISENNFDDRGGGGFTGGYEGFGNDKILWKSTEHNLDIYVAFKRLYEITQNEKWNNLALHAEQFIKAMWNTSGQFYWTGTDQDGITINKKDSVEDVQSWSNLVFNSDTNSQNATEWARLNCAVESDGFKGFDFNVDKDGIWFEGTAQMCLALQNSNRIEDSNFYLNQLRSVQKTANHNNGSGIVAASHDSVSTGLDWLYHNRLHVAATSWYIFAENNFNPYWQTSTITKVKTDDHKSLNTYVLEQNHPNPFNSNTAITFELPISGDIRLVMYNLFGQEIRVLREGFCSSGRHTILFNGSDLASGVYLYCLEIENFKYIKRLVLIK